MSATERPFEAYVYALRERAEQHVAGLDELSDLNDQRPLTFNERNAVERSLQVLVEMAVGCSKQLLKARQRPVPSEARAAIERVYEMLGNIDPPAAMLRGAVGMRNAIIHDYLNLDWGLVERVLKSRKYLLLPYYIHAVTVVLLSEDSG